MSQVACPELTLCTCLPRISLATLLALPSPALALCSEGRTAKSAVNASFYLFPFHPFPSLPTFPFPLMLLSFCAYRFLSDSG